MTLLVSSSPLPGPLLSSMPRLPNDELNRLWPSRPPPIANGDGEPVRDVVAEGEYMEGVVEIVLLTGGGGGGWMRPIDFASDDMTASRRLKSGIDDDAPASDILFRGRLGSCRFLLMDERRDLGALSHRIGRGVWAANWIGRYEDSSNSSVMDNRSPAWTCRRVDDRRKTGCD